MSRFVAVLVLVMLAVPAPASAAHATSLDAVLETTIVPAGSALSVDGTLHTTAQPAQRLWTDTTLAGDLGSFQYPADPSSDLIEGRVEHGAPGDPLSVHIKVAPAIGPEVPGKPYQWFRWPFQIEDIWYFVEFTYLPNSASGAWNGSWYYCKLALGSNCIHGTTPPFPVTYDAASRTYTGKIPLEAMAAVQPDGTLAQDTIRPFSAQYPAEAGYKQTLQSRLDAAPEFEAVELPIASVFYGIGSPGENPDDVETVGTLPVSTDGSLDVGFAGTVPTAGLSPGEHALYLRGCFGPCSVAVLPFTVTA